MRGRGQIISRGVDADGKSVWLLRVFLGRDANGKRKYRNDVFIGTKTDAKKELTAKLGLRDGGNLAVGTRQTVGEWLDVWLAGRKLAVGPRTYLDYTTTLDRYVRPALGAIRLSRLTTADIQQLVNEMDARKLAPNTIRLALAPLGAALAKAVTDGKIVKNPSDGITRRAIPSHVERPVLGPAGAAKLLAVCDADDAWGPLITVLLMTGVRPGELCALKWPDVDGSTLRVQRALMQTEDGPSISDGTTKTKLNRRAIALSDVELRAFARQRKRVAALRLLAGPEWQDNDLVFPTSTGRPHDARNIGARVLPRLLKRAGLPPMRLYDCRHSMATLLLAGGVNPKIVSERLGHSKVGMTLDTYSHVLPTMQREAADTLARLVSAQPVQAGG
jgi:integrase